jgi:hypothetical protein
MARGQDFWGSRSDGIFNFTVSADPGGGFAYIAASKNQFRWLRGQRTMLAGSEANEISITAQSVVVSPGDVQLQEESAFGSAPVMAENIGDQVLYISPDRRKARALLFNLQTNGYVSTDVTYTAEHLTAAGVKEVLWVRDPDTTIGLVLRDGTLAFCVYDRQKMSAWWLFSTAGRVVSAAYSVVEAATWLIANRGEVFYLEQLPAKEDALSQFHVDCYEDVVFRAGVGNRVSRFIGENGEVESSAISGFSRFAGSPVYVMVDGAFYLATVNESGVVSVPTNVSHAVVGVAYPENLVRTLPAEGGMPGGSSQGVLMRRFGLKLRLNRSALPLVNGTRAPERGVDSPMDTPEGLFTGDVSMTQLGWSPGAQIDISQDLPLRTEVCAIFGQTAAKAV